MNILKNKMILKADVFPKLRSPKIVVKQISEKSRDPLTSNGKADQTLLKSEPQHFSHIYANSDGTV